MMLYLGSTATAGQVQVLENSIRENMVPVLNRFSVTGAGCEEGARMRVRKEQQEGEERVRECGKREPL